MIDQVAERYRPSASSTTAAVVVAHPNDETLWSGGFILQRPDWKWFILTLCRVGDPKKVDHFKTALRYFGAEGAMADLDDGVSQAPLDPAAVRHVIREGLPEQAYDFVLSHGANGEYTRNRRHEECSRAVQSLVREGHIVARKLMLFAYDDQNGTRLPKATVTADERYPLEDEIFGRKLHIVTQLYGFSADSWEARTTPRVEGFSCPDTPSKLAVDPCAFRKGTTSGEPAGRIWEPLPVRHRSSLGVSSSALLRG